MSLFESYKLAQKWKRKSEEGIIFDLLLNICAWRWSRAAADPAVFTFIAVNYIIRARLFSLRCILNSSLFELKRGEKRCSWGSKEISWVLARTCRTCYKRLQQQTMDRAAVQWMTYLLIFHQLPRSYQFSCIHSIALLSSKRRSKS